jgi:hypothetical protein
MYQVFGEILSYAERSYGWVKLRKILHNKPIDAERWTTSVCVQTIKSSDKKLHDLYSGD